MPRRKRRKGAAKYDSPSAVEMDSVRSRHVILFSNSNLLICQSLKYTRWQAWTFAQVAALAMVGVIWGASSQNKNWGTNFECWWWWRYWKVFSLVRCCWTSFIPLPAVVCHLFMNSGCVSFNCVCPGEVVGIIQSGFSPSLCYIIIKAARRRRRTLFVVFHANYSPGGRMKFAKLFILIYLFNLCKSPNQFIPFKSRHVSMGTSFVRRRQWQRRRKWLALVEDYNFCWS